LCMHVEYLESKRVETFPIHCTPAGSQVLHREEPSMFRCASLLLLAMFLHGRVSGHKRLLGYGYLGMSLAADRFNVRPIQPIYAAQMLTLSFYKGAAQSPATSIALSDLRVIGGAICNPTRYGLIASYTASGWKHRGQLYSRLALTGGGCLLFGITREPTIVSDVIDHFHFIGRTLRANGVAIARYIEQQDSWHGLIRPMWWISMRIVSSGGLSGLVDHSQIAHVNPWEPSPRVVLPSHRALT
jgi:hypothetical protein